MNLYILVLSVRHGAMEPWLWKEVSSKGLMLYPQYPVYYEQQRPEEAQLHTHHTSCWRDWPSGLGALNDMYSFHSPLLNIYLRLNAFQSSLLHNYFRDGPNRCLHCARVWHKTHPICDTPRKNLQEVTGRTSSPAWNLWKPFTYCSIEENFFRDLTP